MSSRISPTHDNPSGIQKQSTHEYLCNEAKNYGFLCGINTHRQWREYGPFKSCRSYLSGPSLFWERSHFRSSLELLGVTGVEGFMERHFERNFYRGYMQHCETCLGGEESKRVLSGLGKYEVLL